MRKLFTMSNLAFWSLFASFVLAEILGNHDQAATFLVGYTLVYLIGDRRG